MKIRVKIKAKLKILVLHGPNLNLLGERAPEIYGEMTLRQLNGQLRRAAQELNLQVKIFQSNGEGILIDLLHRHRNWADGVILNPAAYTHYSYALRDAVEAMGRPTVEVHLSDIHSREDFRKISVIAPVCVKQISGLGSMSYVEGLKFFCKPLQDHAQPSPGLDFKKVNRS